MDIFIDFSFLTSLVGGNFLLLFRQLFVFLIVFFFIYWIAKIIWQSRVSYVKDMFLAEQQYVLLSINVPRDNEQGPEAVERFFANLAAIKVNPSWFEKNIQGVSQLDISLEIISKNGQIEYLIYAPVHYRDMIEASIYAIYPGVEISESEDYTLGSPEEFPDKEYDLWGADLGLYNKNPFPIRTYPDFEHGLSKELKDPMTGLLEIIGKLLPGEQTWIQFIVRPAGSALKKEGSSLIKSISGEKSDSSDNLFDKVLKVPVKISQIISDLFLDIFGFFNPSGEGDKKEKKPVSPENHKMIEAIQKKISKIAFETRIRVIYLAKKEIFSKDRGVTGILGAFNAINTLDLNGIEIEKKVFDSLKRPQKTESSKESILKAYKKRSLYWQIKPKGMGRILTNLAKFLAIKIGGNKKKNILNIEELATLYHFPVITGRVPLIKKTGSKRGEPPFALPIK